jgi:hypothetical protein
VDDATSLAEYRARIARVEEQLAELQAEVAELKRLLSRPGSQSNFEPDNGLLSGGAATLSLDEESTDLVKPAARSEVVLTILAGAGAHRDPHPAHGGPPEFRPIVFVDTSPELAGWARGQPEVLREHAASLIEGMQERLSQGAAGILVDVVWEPVTAPWHVTDFGGFESLSGLPGALDNWSHEELGNWVSKLGHLGGLPDSAANAAGVVIRYTVPLPIDKPLENLSRGIQVAGIVAFAIAGGHVLACEALKSFVRDELIDSLAGKLRKVIWPQADDLGPTPDARDDPEAMATPEPGTEENGSPEPADSASAADSDFDMEDIDSPVSMSSLLEASGIHLGEERIRYSISPPTPAKDDKDPPGTPSIEI